MLRRTAWAAWTCALLAMSACAPLPQTRSNADPLSPKIGFLRLDKAPASCGCFAFLGKGKTPADDTVLWDLEAGIENHRNMLIDGVLISFSEGAPIGEDRFLKGKPGKIFHSLWTAQGYQLHAQWTTKKTLPCKAGPSCLQQFYEVILEVNREPPRDSPTRVDAKGYCGC